MAVSIGRESATLQPTPKKRLSYALAPLTIVSAFLSTATPAAALVAMAPTDGSTVADDPPLCGLAVSRANTLPQPEDCLDWGLPDTPHFDASGDEQADMQGYGPPSPTTTQPFSAQRQDTSFGERVGAVKWEFGALLAYTVVTQTIVTHETTHFHFQDEGWFGKDTKALGMDKLTHAFDTYAMAEFLHHRIAKRTGEGPGAAIAGAALASTVEMVGETFDAFKVSSGFSFQDVLFNTAGAGFSVLRNTTPGLKDKLDFRLLLVPNSDVYTFKGKRHYAQQRYFFALTLAGFDRFKDSPLRFVELHAGYYGKNFTARDEALGREPKQKLFFGVGLNVKELLFKSPRSEVGNMAGSGLDFLQIPKTAVHV
ncbi:MAG: DUF2279 domain-containing protein, partial [Sphingobium sp.]